MNISLLNFLSPDFVGKTIEKIPGLSSKGLVKSNINLRFYYLDGIRRDKVFIEPIWELSNNIYEEYIELTKGIYEQDEIAGSIFKHDEDDIEGDIFKNKFLNSVIDILLQFKPKKRKFTYNDILKFIEFPAVLDDNNISFIDYHSSSIDNYVSDRNYDIGRLYNYSDDYERYYELYIEYDEQIIIQLINYINIIIGEILSEFPSIEDLPEIQKYLINNS